MSSLTESKKFSFKLWLVLRRVKRVLNSALCALTSFPKVVSFQFEHVAYFQFCERGEKIEQISDSLLNGKQISC